MPIRSITEKPDDHSCPGAQLPRATIGRQEWRCKRCDKLLGIICDGRLHLRFARGHEYLVGFPATSVCRGCQTLNEIPAPSNVTAPSPRQVANR